MYNPFKKKRRRKVDVEKKVVDKSENFILWVQSFTKAVVSAFSLIYIVILFFMVRLLFKQLSFQSMEGINTMITEINETFRIVIGGYLIKSGVENTVKIGSGFFVESLQKKLEANRDQYEFEAAVDPEKDFTFEEESDDDEESVG